jgi:peroxiredoxin Q/BCP
MSMPKLAPGDRAPKFALKDQNGKTVKLADFAGRKLLVYFYPKADTPGCTTQSCAVRDARSGLSRRGVAVVGISPDASDRQRKFDDKYDLGFPLLADEDHAVATAFGVWGKKSMYGRTFDGIKRSSFLIDERGKVLEAWYGVSPKDTVPNAEGALGA